MLKTAAAVSVQAFPAEQGCPLILQNISPCSGTEELGATAGRGRWCGGYYMDSAPRSVPQKLFGLRASVSLSVGWITGVPASFDCCKIL